MTFDELATIAQNKLQSSQLDEVYRTRLDFELSSIRDQGFEPYWLDLYQSGKKFDRNVNGLVFPWLLDILNDAKDPIQTRTEPLVLSSNYAYIKNLTAQLGHAPFDIRLDSDKPDIDIDCLPEARDEIKSYAARRFGEDKVASVGTWQTFLFKQALGEVYSALGLPDRELDQQYSHLGFRQEPGKHLAIALTSNLPDDINELRKEGRGVCVGQVVADGIPKECGFEYDGEKCPNCGSSETDTPNLTTLLKDHELLHKFYHLSSDHERVVKLASRLIGCVRTVGMHAGAIIIADRPLYGNVPMLYDPKYQQWKSLWTEGRNTQLSKFGYNKWDILGLKTLLYINECCRMIEENHGISFGKGLSGLEDVDPHAGRAGVYWKDGVKHDIPLNDPTAIKMADDLKVNGVFQFDTANARDILKNGVSSFNDLLVYNALGHPGPMQMIPTYVARRDGDESEAGWAKKMHPKIYEILKDTYGVCVFQEQWTSLLISVANLSTVQAQEDRKSVAKKLKEKVKAIGERWVAGASSTLGVAEAKAWWPTLETFGRYSFNRCLAHSSKLVDIVTDECYTIEEWYANGRCPIMRSVNSSGETVFDECVAIHNTGLQEIFRVTFGDGTFEDLTIDHKLRCADGDFRTVGEIFAGQHELYVVEDL